MEKQAILKSGATEAKTSRRQPFGSLRYAHFTAYGPSRILKRGGIRRKLQAKLEVSHPGDQYEQEADRVADTVMRMPAPPASPMEFSKIPVFSGGIYRKCSGGKECPREKDEKKGLVQLKVEQAPSGTGSVPDSPVGDLGPGRTLDRATRGFMEARFGHEFGNVRIHTSERAASAARALNAKAFTVGNDVVFGAGQYAPDSLEGKRLISHELAHVIQQKAGGDSRVQRQSQPTFPKSGMRLIGPDADRLVTILGQCGGMSLQRDKNDLVTVKSEGSEKSAESPASRAAIKGFISSAAGVVIDADSSALGAGVGVYSYDYPGYQIIDVNNVLAMAGASGEKKGLGKCDSVLHEISEAVVARRLSGEGKLKEKDLYLASHAKGKKLEQKIRKEKGLPGRDDSKGDMVLIGMEGGVNYLLLESSVYGSGKDVYTQINVVRGIPGPTKVEGGKTVQTVDNNVVASHVVKGEVRFSTQQEAIDVFNKYASNFGFKPLKPQVKKSP